VLWKRSIDAAKNKKKIQTAIQSFPHCPLTSKTMFSKTLVDPLLIALAKFSCMVMVLMAPAAGVQCFHHQDPRLWDNSCNIDGKCLFEGCAMGRGFQSVDDSHFMLTFI